MCRLPATVESEVRDGTNSRPARACSIALIKSKSDARFQHVAVRAAVDGRGDEFVVPVHRQEDDSGFGAISPELLERLKAIELGHRDVQHDHVGPEAPGEVQRLTAVAGKGHDVKVGSKKAADRFQKREVIVGEEDARSGWRRDLHFDQS